MTLFLLLVAASVMMGLMNDGHRASRIGWAVVTGLMPLCCLHLFGWQGFIWQLSLPALALHGLIVLAMPAMQKRALRHD